MRTVVNMLQYATPEDLVLLDELGAGTDPREETQDGFDVKGCWKTVDGELVRTCFNGGGYDQNIYGNSVSIG